MKRLVKPAKLYNVKLKAPASKSVMQRVIAATILSGRNVRVLNPSKADDSMAAMSIAKGFGYNIVEGDNCLDFEYNSFRTSSKIFCGESGLCIRMFTPIAALYEQEIVLTGEGSLLKRPLGMIEKPLEELGVRCIVNKGFLPVRIKGPIVNHEVHVDGSMGSQFLSGLLFALAKAKKNSTVYVKNLKSKPYIDMTIETMNQFNVKLHNENYEVFKIPASIIDNNLNNNN